jgi:hypothetical protein
MGYIDLVISQPPKGNYLKPRDMVGHRVLFLGTSSIEEQPDNMKPGETRQVATVDFVDLDDGHGGLIQWGALVDKPGIVNKLKNQSTAILGRIIVGEAKTGQNPPFLLGEHEPGDMEYVTQVWMPANRDALAGKARQTPRATPQAGQPAPQAGQPAPQAGQTYPAAMPQVPATPVPTPAPQYQPQIPQPVAAAASAAPGGGEYSPEALAAIQRMMANGQLPAFPAPGQ